MLPSEWATVDVSWGEGKKHLYSPDSASLQFHPTYDVADREARKAIEDGAKMVAILQVNRVYKAQPRQIEVIEGLSGQAG
jgi:hypothetical protein